MTSTIAYVFFCVSVSLLPLKATGLRWSATPADGLVLYACSGTAVDIPWKFNTTEGEVIYSMTWDFQGRSQEIIATYVQNSFFASASYSHRVRFVPNAGIILTTVTQRDSGNFTIIINGHDASGASFEAQRTVRLQVSESLPTTDHDLHATQQGVEFNNVTQEFNAVLTCGVFTYVGDPPVSVQWLTPDGLTLPSTDYSQGRFKLLLKNPVTEGTYACMISNDSLEASCSHGKQASVTVDGLVTRLTLMEAREARTEARLAQKDDQLAEKNAQIDQLTSTLKTVQGHIAPPVAFTARLRQNQHLTYPDTLVLDDVLLNQGQAYSPSTGIFTAPCNGTFHFTVYAGAVYSSKYTRFVLHTNSAAHSGNLFYSIAYNDGHPQTASLQATLYLLKGEGVWVRAYSDSYFSSSYYTAFSGFLISVTGSGQ